MLGGIEADNGEGVTMRGTRGIVMVLAAVTLVLGVAVEPALGAGTSASGAAQAAGEGAVAEGWRQVSVGAAHTCAISESRRLYCWGSDAAGQLGDGGDNTDQSTPVEVVGGRTDWGRVSAGGVSTCARTTIGLGKDHFMEDPDFKLQYEELN